MHLAGLGRTALGAAALLTAWMAGAATVDAQEIITTIRSFEGRSSNFALERLTEQAHRINGSECDAAIRFRFNEIDPTRSQLQFFEGSQCNDVTVRNDNTSDLCTPLDIPSVAINGLREVETTITASQLVPCEEGGSGVVNIWVLAVDNSTSEVNGAGQMDQFDIGFAFEGLPAPGGFTASGGEAAIILSWDVLSAAQSYDVFVDPMGCTDGVVTSERLMRDPPDDTLNPTRIGMGTSANIAWPEGVAIGDEVAVAIRALDRTGNLGDLSQILCVTRIETISWWDMMCPPGSTDEICTGGGCAVSPGRSGAGALALLGLALAAFVARRRLR